MNFRSKRLSVLINRISLLSVLFFQGVIQAQEPAPLPVRGLLISVPDNSRVDEFVDFIGELPNHNVNTLVLRINYSYAFTSRPEVTDRRALSREQVEKILEACRENDIELIPLVNCLGHQSWRRNNIHSLLRAHPEFEENPGDKINDDDFYCRSYCPLHPEVHEVVFDILDELVDVFQSKKIHVGMDEVFILGEDSCPRCSGKDKAELFAGEVTRLHNHLAERGVEMWMWGDRLIDAETSGLNKWRASMNGTHDAIDMIPKDVVICDWQYPSAEGTAYYFALKGFRVISCPHQRPEVGIALANMQRMFRENSVPSIQQRFMGVMQTSWASAESFIDAYHTDSDNETQEGAVECFTEIMDIAAGGNN